jgi:hypothetical protein
MGPNAHFFQRVGMPDRILMEFIITVHTLRAVVRLPTGKIHLSYFRSYIKLDIMIVSSQRVLEGAPIVSAAFTRSHSGAAKYLELFGPLCETAVAYRRVFYKLNRTLNISFIRRLLPQQGIIR